MAQDRAPARFRSLALAAAEAAEDKKGEDIVLLNVRPLTSLADFVLIVSAQSGAQLDAIEEKIERSLKVKEAAILHRDGRGSGSWRVLDYGALMIHLMSPEARAFFALEKAFAGARRVEVSHA